jgi:DNA-binding NarL/FixJ family response regulator
MAERVAAPGGRPVRLLVADDQPMLRAGFRRVLGELAGIDVVGEAADGFEAVELARRLLPDVMLLEPRLPRQDGAAVTRAIVAAGLPVRILLLTDASAGRAGPDDTANSPAWAALGAGAGGLLAKETPAEELVAAIRAVAAGHAVLDPITLIHLLSVSGLPGRLARRPGMWSETPAERPEDRPDGGTGAAVALATLTDREREVLVLVARGRSNAEIAAELQVGETTVKTHLGRLLVKLGLRDRIAAVVLAYEHGLVGAGG